MHAEILPLAFMQGNNRYIVPLNAMAEVSGISQADNSMTIAVRGHMIDQIDQAVF